jgi:hypothetical protein
MAKKSLKIFGIGIGTLIIVVGVIIGILFGTGVLGKKSSSPSEPPSPDDPSPHGGQTTCLANPPKVYNFTKNFHGSYILYFTPGLRNECVEKYDWRYGINVRRDDHRAYGQVNEMNATTGQATVDNIEIDADPSKVKWVEGEVWIQGIPKDGTGGIIKSNEYRYRFDIK